MWWGDVSSVTGAPLYSTNSWRASAVCATYQRNGALPCGLRCEVTHFSLRLNTEHYYMIQFRCTGSPTVRFSLWNLLYCFLNSEPMILNVCVCGFFLWCFYGLSIFGFLKTFSIRDVFGYPSHSSTIIYIKLLFSGNSGFSKSIKSNTVFYFNSYFSFWP